MKKTGIFLFLLSVAALTFSCGDVKRKLGLVRIPVYKPVVIPAAYAADRNAQYSYLARHWWDNVDFADTMWLVYPDVLRTAMEGYVDMLGNVPQPEANVSMRLLMEKSKTNDSVLMMVAGMLEGYLDQRDSPMRNEELYIPVLRFMATSTVSPGVRRRAAARLETALMNRPGEPAHQFEFVMLDDSVTTLYNVESALTMLCFYDPADSLCAAGLEKVKADYIVNSFSNWGRMSLLAVCVGGNEKQWRASIDTLDTSWVWVRDSEDKIRGDRLYDLSSLPALYLLDAAKTVILKDATIFELERFLGEVQRVRLEELKRERRLEMLQGNRKSEAPDEKLPNEGEEIAPQPAEKPRKDSVKLTDSVRPVPQETPGGR